MSFLARSLSKSFFGKQIYSRAYSTFTPPAYLSNVAPTSVTTLPNGIRVAVLKTNSDLATVGVYLQAGSSYENETTSGTANFMKEVIFADSECKGLARLRAIGAQVEGNIGRELSSFTSIGMANDAGQIIEILGRIIQKKGFKPSVIEAARRRTLSQKIVSEGDHEQSIFDYLHAAAYQNSSLANTVIGNRSVLKDIKASDLKKWISQFVTSNRLVVVAAGNVNEEQIIKSAQNVFGGVGNADINDYPIYSPFNEVIGSEIRVRDDTLHDIYGAQAAESVGWTHPDYFAFNVLKENIGSWDSSLGGTNCLNSRFSEKAFNRNMASCFKTFNLTYKDTGLFGIYFVSDYTRIETLTSAIAYEFSLNRGSTVEEIDRAKTITRAAYLSKIRNPIDLIDDIAVQVINYGRHQSPAEVALRIEAVTPSDIQRIAWTYLHDVDPIVALIGPVKYVPDYGVFRTRTTSI